MLSWTFAAAVVLLALLPPGLPVRLRTVALAALSIAAVALIWRVPVLPILAASVAVHALGRVLPRMPPARRRWALWVAIGALVAVLAAVKRGGGPGPTLAGTASVVGLSYFSLKFIQHLADAAGGRAAAVDLPAFLCTIFFLPTYAAGPIERSNEFARKLEHSGGGWLERVFGLERVVLGVGKKFLLADPLLAYAEPLFRAAPGGSAAGVLAAIYALALGLYLDFAGYSDLAIGVARCAGIQVRENFDHPYLRRNIGLLWQHWHMSLTGWLRDFVFLPLTRRVLRWTRRPLLSQVAGQVATMTLCGLWHGLAWHFALWGVYNGIALGALAAWRSWRGPAPAGAPLRDGLATLITFHVFAFGLVLFACDVRQAGRVVARLLAL